MNVANAGVNENIGERSIHQQWDKLIINILNVANDNKIDAKQRRQKIEDMLRV
jgi:hypothetical protein